MPASMPWKKIALAGAVAAVLFVAYRLRLFELFGDPARLKETLLRLGPLGFLAYLLAFALLQPFGLSGVVFTVAASLVWPPTVAIALSLTGCTLASATGFLFARYLARDWVEKRIPARLRRYDERLEAHGFATVLVLRLIFWMNPSLHALFGLSRVHFWTHLLASFLAYVPITVAFTFLGNALFEIFRNQPASRWIELALAIALAAGAALVLKQIKGRSRVG